MLNILNGLILGVKIRIEFAFLYFFFPLISLVVKKLVGIGLYSDCHFCTSAQVCSVVFSLIMHTKWMGVYELANLP